MKRGDTVRLLNRKRTYVVRCNGAGRQVMLCRQARERKKPIFDWYPSEEFELCPMQ
jgi:hypothetical protein